MTVCSLSRGVPSTSRPRLHQEGAIIASSRSPVKQYSLALSDSGDRTQSDRFHLFVEGVAAALSHAWGATGDHDLAAAAPPTQCSSTALRDALGLAIAPPSAPPPRY
ncbi:protein of unknown function [Thauera humireducens]|nr:protein of unknown function [Thauera humireducens]